MEPVRVEKQGSLIVGTFPSIPEVAAVSAFFDRMDEIISEGRPFALLLDASRVVKTDAAVRELAGRRLKERALERKRLVRGEAVVLSSAIVRGVLAAMYLVAPPGYPSKTFSNVAEARKWLDTKLAENSLRSSP